MKNVVTRTLSGIVYVAVFVSAIIFGAKTFGLLALFLSLAGVREFLSLEKARKGEPDSRIVTIISMAVALAMIAVSYSIAAFVPSVPSNTLFLVVCSTLGCVTVGWLILMLWSTLTVTNDAQHSLGTYLTAIFYIVLPMSLLSVAYVVPGGAKLLLAALIAIWINDTGAYCVGCLFGKHKLCERLSPKKTWEGFFGGMFFVVLAAVISSIVIGKYLFVMVVLAVLISVAATLGDLFESRLKRSASVKDSGRIIPGHGGVLDRIDSFLFVVYVILPLVFVLAFEL